MLQRIVSIWVILAGWLLLRGLGKIGMLLGQRHEAVQDVADGPRVAPESKFGLVAEIEVVGRLGLEVFLLLCVAARVAGLCHQHVRHHLKGALLLVVVAYPEVVLGVLY